MTTRFRAYQLANAGSSYSYFDGKTFTLFEARLTDDNRNSIWHEIKRCGQTKIDVLHITSWDFDHCKPSELTEILTKMRPSRVEFPGYSVFQQGSAAAIESWGIIQRWVAAQALVTRQYTTSYVNNLPPGQSYRKNNIVFWPKELDPDSNNNNSTVMLFRGGHFNVLSPGDIESEDAALALMDGLAAETDVLILPHHGSEHGIISKALLEHLSPKVAVCTANYKNHFKHPRDSVRKLLSSLSIPLCTTKMGDVIIECTDGTTATVSDYKSDGSGGYTPHKNMSFRV